MLAPEERLARKTIADRFELEGIIGEGGMSVVFAARDLVIDRRVALKFLLPALADRADIAKRFADEARTASKIDHPNVVRIYDVARDVDGAPFIVMERLQGRGLDAVPRPMSVEDARAILEPVTDAVAAAHALGIIHRDLKPENIFLHVDGRGTVVPKVLDFGIAKLASSAPASLGVVGTPRYMAPERLRGEPATPAVDVWALAVIWYELLTDDHPIDLREAETPVDVAKLVSERTPRPLSSQRVPARVATAIDGALSVASSGRPADARVFLEAMKAAHAKVATTVKMEPTAPKLRGDTVPIPARGANVLAPPAVRREDAPASSKEPEPSSPSSQRTSTLAVALSFVALAAAVGAWWSHRTSAPPPPPVVGRVAFSNLPPDAMILIDGAARSTDLDGRVALPAGGHRVAVAGFRDLDVEVVSGETVRVELTPTRGVAGPAPTETTVAGTPPATVIEPPPPAPELRSRCLGEWSGGFNCQDGYCDASITLTIEAPDATGRCGTIAWNHSEYGGPGTAELSGCAIGEHHAEFGSPGRGALHDVNIFCAPDDTASLTAADAVLEGTHTGTMHRRGSRPDQAVPTASDPATHPCLGAWSGESTVLGGTLQLEISELGNARCGRLDDDGYWYVVTHCAVDGMLVSGSTEHGAFTLDCDGGNGRAALRSSSNAWGRVSMRQRP